MSPGKNNRFTDFQTNIQVAHHKKRKQTRKIYHLGIFWRHCLKTFIDRNDLDHSQKAILLWWYFKGIKKNNLIQICKLLPKGSLEHLSTEQPRQGGTCTPLLLTTLKLWCIRDQGSLKRCCTVLNRHAPYANMCSCFSRFSHNWQNITTIFEGKLQVWQNRISGRYRYKTASTWALGANNLNSKEYN